MAAEVRENAVGVMSAKKNELLGRALPISRVSPLVRQPDFVILGAARQDRRGWRRAAGVLPGPDRPRPGSAPVRRAPRCRVG
jgi:hypothetical protein